MRADLRRPTAIITDIEGTTTPISFVRDVLFPYARTHLARYLKLQGRHPVVRAIVAEAASLADGQPVEQALLAWMDADAKVTPLKTLQGLMWDEGYKRGELKGVIYPDVPPVLRRWRASGIRLFVYSSGSVAAQKLLFKHSDAGDLTDLFSGYFDTRAGPKRSAESYASIAAGLGLPAGEILFLSDVAEELDAAEEAGMSGCQVVRAADGTQGSANHLQAADFAAVQAMLE